jgi:dephospho-CoA kinase
VRVRIAVTGGIAEGKSTVLGYLRDLGFPTTSADEVARRLFDEPEVNAALAAAAGVEPPIGRDRLRDALHEDAPVRRRVNRIMHPRIAARLVQVENGFIEVPLLVEACLQGAFDHVWVVVAGPEEQLRRLAARLGSAAAAEAALGTQLPTAVKLAFADVEIRTNSPEASVRQVVTGLAKRLPPR